MSAWTFEDERKLNELKARREQVRKSYFDAVVKVANAIHSYNMSADDIAEQLVDHAAEVVNALTPFVNKIVPK